LEVSSKNVPFFGFCSEFKGFYLKLGIFLIEFVKGTDELLMVFLEVGEGGVFMGKYGKTIVIFFELIVGGLELGHTLRKVLVMGISFLEKFLENGKIGEELLLG